MSKELRLLIAVPSTQQWEADFGMSLVFMTNFLASHSVPGFASMTFRVHNKRGSILAQMRQSIIEDAIKNKATHVLFIDSDQTFPRDLVHRLIAHKKHIVAANIATKKIPPDPTARARGKEHFGELVYTTPESTGLQEVWRVGTGVMLIDLNCFKRAELKEGPWFSQHWNEETGHYVGEDWAFCERLEKAGVKIYIDHDVSKEVGHLGKLNYGHDMIEAVAMQEAG